MKNLSVAYQKERPNVEADEQTALAIQAWGLILGKLVRDEGGIGGIGGSGGIATKRYFLLTKLIATASQTIVEVKELDINYDLVTSIHCYISNRNSLVVRHFSAVSGNATKVANYELKNHCVTVYSRRIGNVLKNLRLIHAKQPRTGNRGWLISLDDLFRWSKSYGLDIEEITGIPHLTQVVNATSAANAANATLVKPA